MGGLSGGRGVAWWRHTLPGQVGYVNCLTRKSTHSVLLLVFKTTAYCGMWPETLSDMTVSAADTQTLIVNSVNCPQGQPRQSVTHWNLCLAKQWLVYKPRLSETSWPPASDVCLATNSVDHHKWINTELTKQVNHTPMALLHSRGLVTSVNSISCKWESQSVSVIDIQKEDLRTKWPA